MQEILEKRYELKTQRIGEGVDKKGVKKSSEGQVLNRVIRRVAGGFDLEVDLRHAELIVEQLELQSSRPVVTPGVELDVKCVVWENDEEPEEEELPAADATSFGAIAARCNFLAIDRPDLMYAAKECSRKMAKPQNGDWSALKRIGRYLIYRPRVVHKFVWQERPEGLSAYSDSNWAGCHETRKSTSGACFMYGSHLLKAYSRTQSNIALSSGEAEYYALVATASEALGLVAMTDDFGDKSDAYLYADASAAIGVANREGLGRIRHLDTQSLSGYSRR